MIGHLAARAAFHATLLLGVVVGTFLLFEVVPEDPARTILGPNASVEQVVEFRRQLGLDRPLAVRATRFLASAVRLDFGRSYIDARRVGPEVLERLEASLALVVVSVAITALYLAIVLPLEHRTGWRFGVALEFMLVSTPTLLAGVLMALVAGKFWPYIAYSGNLDTAVAWLALVPPGLALALYPIAILSRILRGELARLDLEPFITAVRAQGFSESYIRYVFALKNACIPSLAALSTLLPALFTGAFIVEVIFSVPATGTLLARSVLQRDLPMIEGLVICSALIVSACHFAVEFISAALDPRLAHHAR